MTVVIPAYNEQKTIANTIVDIPVRELTQNGYSVNIFVINNRSTDDTENIALSCGATVLREEKAGKGFAIQKAFSEVRSDYIFMIDADYTYPGKYIIPMLKLLSINDVVLGSRLSKKSTMTPGAMSSINKFGNRCLTIFANVLYFRHITDLCTGLWGFKGTIPSQLKLSEGKFGLEANMFSQVVRHGYKLTEIPIGYRDRSGTKSKLKIGDGIKIAWVLLRERFA